ncbi:MAG: hypothetical protein O8C63_10030 [Candidatus Methanoperedens sp.]|nr:hypothetical protein [Candidatus Methanoperedens sp.]
MNAGKKKCGLIKLAMITLILSGFISIALALDNPVQWAPGVSAKLERGGNITLGEYSVKAVSFPAPVEHDKYMNIPAEPVEQFAGLNISKKGILIDTIVLGLGESYISPDNELKVTVKDMPSKDSKVWLFESYEPWATIELDPRGKPELSVSVETDKTEYALSSATEIVTVVTLRNTGTADAFNVGMKLKTDLPIKRGSLNFHYDRVKKGSASETITFSLPKIVKTKSYEIVANATGYDVKEHPYTTESENTISVLTEPQVSLSINKSANDRIYLKDFAIVSLTVKNNAKDDLKNVSVTDYVPDGFKLTNNNSLHWVFDLPAMGYWDFHYLIKPQVPDPDGIVLPSAMAEFTYENEFYSVKSNEVAVVVYGPSIVLDKKTDVSEINPNDLVTVTVVARNSGTTPTRVNVTDALPPDATIVSGSTSTEAYLEANNEVKFSYAFKINSKQQIKLPRATAEYYELGNKGAKISTESQELEIKIKSPVITKQAPVPQITTPQPAQAPTPVPTEAQIPQSEKPVIQSVVRKPQMSPAEVDSLLNLLLGCNDNTNTSLTASAGCKFYGFSSTS